MDGGIGLGGVGGTRVDGKRVDICYVVVAG